MAVRLGRAPSCPALAFSRAAGQASPRAEPTASRRACLTAVRQASPARPAHEGPASARPDAERSARTAAAVPKAAVLEAARVRRARTAGQEPPAVEVVCSAAARRGATPPGGPARSDLSTVAAEAAGLAEVAYRSAPVGQAANRLKRLGRTNLAASGAAAGIVGRQPVAEHRRAAKEPAAANSEGAIDRRAASAGRAFRLAAAVGLAVPAAASTAATPGAGLKVVAIAGSGRSVVAVAGVAVAASVGKARHVEVAHSRLADLMDNPTAVAAESRDAAAHHHPAPVAHQSPTRGWDTRQHPAASPLEAACPAEPTDQVAPRPAPAVASRAAPAGTDRPLAGRTAGS